MKDELFSRLKKRVAQEGIISEAIQNNYVEEDGNKDSLKGEYKRRPLSYQQPIPDDMWVRCPSCNGAMLKEDFEHNDQVCLQCNHHFRINAWERIWLVADKGSFQEMDKTLSPKNPIQFDTYAEKVRKLQLETGLHEAIVSGKAKIFGMEVYLAAMDSRFIMGSMGQVVGEKIVRITERATEEKLPLIIFSVSGGARMQEGIVSLMQMASTSAAIERHNQAGLLYISFLTDPTTGGVTASFASLGDIILSEPGTIIGFAGRRVIEGTISEKLPEDFQRAEFQMQHGFLDGIISRSSIRHALGSLLSFHNPHAHSDSKLSQMMKRSRDMSEQAAGGTGSQELECARVLKVGVDEISTRKASDCLDLIRHKDRPTIMQYLPLIFDTFYELKGDRLFADDPAIWGGLGLLNGEPVTIIAERKGRNLEENNHCNFGMPHPEGYRKALRLMRQAEKFGRPILTFVDTAGAYCGVGAEERGQGQAIAENLAKMSKLNVPIVTVVIGEGGSGGALGIAVCDKLAMLSNSIYSVISPRGFASLIWKDQSLEREAADIMHITAKDLADLGIADYVIEECGEGSHASVQETADGIKSFFVTALQDIRKESQTKEELLEKRYRKFRDIGPFFYEK